MRHHKYHKYHNHDAFAPIGQIFEELFNKSIGDIVGADFSHNTPSANTYETDDDYILEVAAPGINKADIDITIEQDYLIVSADISAKADLPKYKRREFNYNKFSRRFKLNNDINLGGISASYALGVLQITLPKLDADSVNKKTKIQVG